MFTQLPAVDRGSSVVWRAWLRYGEDWRVACYRKVPARPHVWGGDCHEHCLLLYCSALSVSRASSSFLFLLPLPPLSIFLCLLFCCLFLLRPLCLCFCRVSHSSFPSPCSCFTYFSFLPLPPFVIIHPLPPPSHNLILFVIPPPSSSCFYSYISFALPFFFCFSSPLFLFFIQPFTRLRKVRPCYNDTGFCDISSITQILCGTN